MADRIVVGMTGATGQIFGIRALELLDGTDYESHLIISPSAKVNLDHEGDWALSEVRALADETHEHGNIGAAPASGSFQTAGMLVAPCSMKTLSNVAHGNASDLIARAADVTLKERRSLVVMPREAPFNRIHLQNMLDVTDAGGIVMPPFLAFYQTENDLDAMVPQTVARALGFFGVDLDVDEWTGL